jgi:hypothetical protein
MKTFLIGLLAAGGALVSETGRADDCPPTPPADAVERRAAAKHWFTEAEAAERRRDDLAALHAYQCSMLMIPHAFTSYNLARVAEQTGDVELALDSFRTYLVLKPAAEDRAAVTSRIRLLEQRVAAIRDQRAAAAAAADPPPASPVAFPAPAPPLAEPAAPPPVPSAPRRLALRRADWIVAGAAAGSLVAGLTLNLLARGRMGDCRTLADQDRLAEALGACHGARPLAYASYGLLGAAAAAVAVDAALVVRRGRVERVALVPAAGALSVAVQGGF